MMKGRFREKTNSSCPPSFRSMKAQKNDTLAGLKPLRGAVIDGNKVRLREKKLTDVRADYRWQSDPELSKLDAAPALIMSFALYLLDYTAIMHEDSQHRYPLAVETGTVNTSATARCMISMRSRARARSAL